MRITSPLGRLGLPGTIRIVAQVSHPPQVALGSVRFYVNDALVGDDQEGPPYAVEWTDANPFEPTRIRVEASDALGNVVSDAIELAPFEIVETTGVSSVLLEATVVDKADRFVGGLDAASFRVAGERRAADDRPRAHRIAAGDLHPARGREPEHARPHGVRSQRPRDGSPTSSGRTIASSWRRSRSRSEPITGPTGDRETIAGAVAAIASRGGTAIADGLIEASRLVAGAEGRHVIVLITDGYDEDSQTKMEDALVAAQSAHAAVYVIGVGGVAGISLKGERALRQIARETGGRVFFPSREAGAACRARARRRGRAAALSDYLLARESDR